MSRILWVMLANISLSACASGPFSANRDLDSSGKQTGQVVTCSGYKTWNDCNLAATKLCGGEYEVLAKEENIVMQARTIRFICK